MNVDLPDGLYRVCVPYLTAGFVVRAGQIEECAPILRNRICYWVVKAELVEPPVEALNDGQ